MKIDNLSSVDEIEGYEYLIIVQILNTSNIKGRRDISTLASLFSRTAKKMAEEAGMSVDSYFRPIGID